MIVDLKRYAVFFILGGVGYGIIEFFWRGYTHWSMMIAGGMAFISFSLIADKLSEVPLILKAMLGAACVTVIEFVFGVVFNIALGMEVWDYGSESYNLMGQICPRFTALWVILSLIFIPIAGILNGWIERTWRA